MKYIIALLLLSSTSTFCFAESPFVQVTDQGMRTHSGIVIETGNTIKVLTCSHMKQFHNSKRINVRFFDNLTYISLPAKIEKFDYGKDLMLLSISNRANIKIKPVKIASEVKNVKSIINGYGSNGFKQVFVVYTPVESYANFGKPNQSQLSVFTGIGISGMSGSGILQYGNIVSIQSSKDKYRITGASIAEIRKFLKE